MLRVKKHFGELMIGVGIKLGAGDGPQQDLATQRRYAFLFGHQADHRRHIAAGAVADHRQPRTVDVDLLAVLGHLFGGGVSQVDGLRVAHLR